MRKHQSIRINRADCQYYIHILDKTVQLNCVGASWFNSLRMFKSYIILAIIVAIQLLCSTANSSSLPDDYDEEGEDYAPEMEEYEELSKEEEGNDVDVEMSTPIITALDPRTQPPNEFVDFVLDTLRTILEFGGNEIPLPKSTQSVQERIWGFIFRAHAKFYDGKVKGLQSVRRSGVAKIYTLLGPLWVFDIELRDIEFNYGFSFEVMGVGPMGHMKGTLETITIGLYLKMSSNGGLLIQDFDVKDVGDFIVETSGLGDLNPIVNQIGNAIGDAGKGILLESLEDKLKELMNEALARVSVGA